MIATISTKLETTEEKMWGLITEPKSLQYVSFPILSFTSEVPSELDAKWIVGKKYNLSLHLFEVFPLGRHVIEVMCINQAELIIETHEGGLLAPVWDHTINIQQCDDKKLNYTDTIEIKAGLLTPVIWLFAQLFYRHRQKRWKKLLI